jgi:2-keto-4-pentenoate hydratase/2-oxohepta-3-ene-1,7-dioic acid hydratase in catechol pathway
MKICRFEHKNQIKTGVYEPDYEKVIDDETKEVLAVAEVEMLLPVAPSKIVCVGRNYAEHAAELGNEVPKEPLLFLKAPSALLGDGENIVIPPQSNQVEHEGELAIVIGKTCKNLSETDNPLEYVLGFTCLNDVTARDIQRKDVQFTRGKSFDTFCPILNYLETDLDVSDIRVVTRVNGIIKQDSRTSRMVFSVPFLIYYISNQMTLKEGDLIATGTPSGVSKMTDGDLCEVEIEGIGVLKNKVVSALL